MTDHDPTHGARLMTAPTPATALVEDYLTRLRTATSDLPQAPRAELLDQIGAHLAETVPPGTDETAARQALDELGRPEEIAAAARAETTPDARPDRSGSTAYDVITVLALLVGGFVVPLLGWVAGIAMLWSGPRWSTREKVLGTLAWPLAVVALVVGLWALSIQPGGIAGLVGLAVLVVVLAAGFVAIFAFLLRVALARG
ncbi:HAAS signaling domain-containing protein [Pseudonocardia abyssalis]|uniref:DUF1700 domain-containing protein n=1 Tax=Pseudonocardia abyssalis TaxID=2792008 RepID=A0ABS6UL25_9PSEU|nr:hypothetical protein [Pseudonocardia abyssalis]MBW0116875.1 hypothetical protein [Pseudonocardia abyssalis]MBW0132927.1 hypothetical protein [Pseudonocardia abyssalis]